MTSPIAFCSLARKEGSEDPLHSILQRRLSSYFAGNYRKYEARLVDDSYILKFAKTEYPELARVEYVSNRIASRCGLSVAGPFALIDWEGELAFIAKNFMSGRKSPATLTHVYHYLAPDDTAYTVEGISQAIFRETGSAVDMEAFFKIVLFDALVGNHDRHGRNLAFIETARGKRLAPAYDNPSALGLESGMMLGADFSPKGKIWTEHSTEPEMSDYLDEMQRLDVWHVVLEFYRNMNIQAVMSEIDAVPVLSSRMAAALKRLILKRYAELERRCKK